jgi:hypothetical protein
VNPYFRILEPQYSVFVLMLKADEVTKHVFEPESILLFLNIIPKSINKKLASVTTIPSWKENIRFLADRPGRVASLEWLHYRWYRCMQR